MIETEQIRQASLKSLSNSGTISIASVTVVYNGGSVLRKHLDGLKSQSRQLDEMIVVDNASSDDTLEILANEYPEVTVLKLSNNSGVGGALAAGLAHAAFEKQYDWVWLFDQDSVPAPDCLDKLLGGLQSMNGKQAGVGILAPICADAATGVPSLGLEWRGAKLQPVHSDPESLISLVDSVISSGSLIRRRALNAAGLPRADFFMDFVDHEHCLRLRRHGFEIAIVRDSRLQHALGEPSRIEFAGRSKYWSDHAPWREYYMTRNEIFTLWHHYPRVAVKLHALLRMARHGLEILLFGKEKFACLRMMCRGFVDGRAGRLGIRSFAEAGRNVTEASE